MSHSHDPVSCQKLILEHLGAYEDGSMPEPERSEFRKHLEKCPPCLSFLNTYRATGRTLKMLKPREIPCDLVRAVIAFVKARQGDPQ